MLQLGVDVGGTFTDFILADTEKKSFAIHKVPTTSLDPSIGVVEGVRVLTDREGVELGRVEHEDLVTTGADEGVLGETARHNQPLVPLEVAEAPKPRVLAFSIAVVAPSRCQG